MMPSETLRGWATPELLDADPDAHAALLQLANDVADYEHLAGRLERVTLATLGDALDLRCLKAFPAVEDAWVVLRRDLQALQGQDEERRKAADAELSRLENESEEAHKRADKLQDELDTANQRIEELSTQVDRLEAADESKERIGHLEQDLAEARRDAAADHEKLLARVDELTAQLAEAQAAPTPADDKAAQLQAVLEAVKTALRTAEARGLVVFPS